MVGGIVIADRGVEAAGARGEIGIRFVGQRITFYVQAERVGGIRTQDDLPKKTQMIGELRGHKKIELTGLEGSMGRRGRIPAGAATPVDDREDQWIGDGTGAEIEVEESSNVQDWSSRNGHAVFVVSRFGLRRSDGD